MAKEILSSSRKHLFLCDGLWRQRPPYTPGPRGTSPIGFPRRRSRRDSPSATGASGRPPAPIVMIICFEMLTLIQKELIDNVRSAIMKRREGRP